MENINNNNNDDNNNIDNNLRVNRGRRRIEMARMKNEFNLQVTFSKRRAGLFKKASELCTLCGVDMALLVFSPGKKVFSFGNPSLEAVLERYANNHLLPDAEGGSGSGAGARASEDGGVSAGIGNGALQLMEGHRKTKLQTLNFQLTQVMGKLRTEKKLGEEMTKLRKANQDECWWERPVEMLDMEQLGQLKSSLEELKTLVDQQAERIRIQASAALNDAGPPPIHYPLAPHPPSPPQPQFYPPTLVGFGPLGESSGMMVPFNNINNGGFGSTGVVPYSGGSVNNINNNDDHGGMMNLPPPPLPPSPAPQQSRGGYNGIGYGGGGFY